MQGDLYHNVLQNSSNLYTFIPLPWEQKMQNMFLLIEGEFYF